MMNVQLPRFGTLMLVFLLITVSVTQAQRKPAYPEDALRQDEYTAHLRFLASDELMGRMTGSLWIDVAARYVAEQFRASALQKFPGATDYFQLVPLQRRIAPSTARIVLLGDTLIQGENMLMRNGGAIDWKGQFVYVGYGIVDPEKNIDEFKGLDVWGKIVIAKFGAGDNSNLFGALTSIGERKRKDASERGAVALIESYPGPRPWRQIVGFLTRSGIELDAGGGDFPHFIAQDTTSSFVKRAEASTGGTASVRAEAFRVEKVRAQNVIGFIKGSDPKLRDEYVLLTAHYDHIGTRKTAESPNDTIFNGARDNAMGTVALFAAARSFSANPPKRSVIIAALTGEEIGEFGSRYMADHPPVPMNQIVYDLNIDGAGFDDTTIVTVVGLERTTAETPIKQGSSRYGLTAIPDPVPEQNLFNRSDNVNFARKGVPAPTFSEGFRSFGAEILKYYHQPSDEANDAFNYSYALKFYKAFVHSARLIADMKDRPFWKPGDAYEKAGLKLYQK